MSQTILPQDLKNLVSVSRKDDQFLAKFEWSEEVTNTYSLPCYTGNTKINGTPTKSQTLRKTYQHTKTENRELLVIIEKAQAQALFEAAKAVGMVKQIERLAGKDWIARIS